MATHFADPPRTRASSPPPREVAGAPRPRVPGTAMPIGYKRVRTHQGDPLGDYVRHIGTNLQMRLSELDALVARVDRVMAGEEDLVEDRPLNELAGGAPTPGDVAGDEGGPPHEPGAEDLDRRDLPSVGEVAALTARVVELEAQLAALATTVEGLRSTTRPARQRAPKDSAAAETLSPAEARSGAGDEAPSGAEPPGTTT